MASLNSIQFSTTTTTTTFLLIIIVLLHNMFCPVSSSDKPQQPAISSREQLLFEEKNRLGSMPPSCHNKCNDCHPCMAVQVPTMPHQTSQKQNTFLNPSSIQGGGNNNRYSNYKPLGWKCHCGDHFFNP